MKQNPLNMMPNNEWEWEKYDTPPKNSLGKSRLFEIRIPDWQQNDSSPLRPIVHSHQKGQVAYRLHPNPIWSKMLCWVFETNSAGHFYILGENILTAAMPKDAVMTHEKFGQKRDIEDWIIARIVL